MLEGNEHWIGPFQIRKILENCIDPNFPKIPDHSSCYLITCNSWRKFPTSRHYPLYVGGNTGNSKRFRTRVGDLLADAFGFFVAVENEFGEYVRPITGHSSGGTSLNYWCKRNNVNPLDLYLSWIEGTSCHRCLEVRVFEKLKPELNKKNPPPCETHAKL